MPENAPPQVETAAEPIVAAPPAPIEITLENIDQFTPEQQHFALFGGKPPVAVVKPPAEKPPEVIPESVIVAPPPEKILPDRIRTGQFDPEEQEAIALKHDLAAKGEKISLGQAIERVAAKYAATKAPPTPDPAPVVIENPHAALEKELKDLLDRRPEFTDQVGEERDAFEDQLAEARVALSAARIKAEVVAETLKTVAVETQKQTASRVATERVRARQGFMDEVLSVYKTADADDSALNARISAKFNKIDSNPEHPDRARFFDQLDGPKWLVEQVAAEYAAELQTYGFTADEAMESVRSGNPPTRAKSPVSAPAPKPQQLPVPRGLVTSTRVTSPPPVAPAMTLEEILRRGTTDEKFRNAVLFGPNKRR